MGLCRNIEKKLIAIPIKFAFRRLHTNRLFSLHIRIYIDVYRRKFNYLRIMLHIYILYIVVKRLMNILNFAVRVVVTCCKFE